MREVRAYIAEDHPQAAGRLITRIVTVVEALKEHPFLVAQVRQAERESW